MDQFLSTTFHNIFNYSIGLFFYMPTFYKNLTKNQSNLITISPPRLISREIIYLHLIYNSPGDEFRINSTSLFRVAAASRAIETVFPRLATSLANSTNSSTIPWRLIFRELIHLPHIYNFPGDEFRINFPSPPSGGIETVFPRVATSARRGIPIILLRLTYSTDKSRNPVRLISRELIHLPDLYNSPGDGFLINFPSPPSGGIETVFPRLRSHSISHTQLYTSYSQLGSGVIRACHCTITMSIYT